MDTPIRGLKANSIICDDYWVDGRLMTMTQEQYDALPVERKTYKDTNWTPEMLYFGGFLPYDFPLYEKISTRCDNAMAKLKRPHA
jgi:hypothetical protein